MIGIIFHWKRCLLFLIEQDGVFPETFLSVGHIHPVEKPPKEGVLALTSTTCGPPVSIKLPLPQKQKPLFAQIVCRRHFMLLF